MASSPQVKPRPFTIPVQKLLDELGLRLLDAFESNKSEWHIITRPEALLARHPSYQPQVATQVDPTALCCHRGAAVTSRAALAAGASVTSIPFSASVTPITFEHANLSPGEGSPRSLKPTKPAVQISDVDRKRKIPITDKCTMTIKKWREKVSPSG
jgi:hypothetical protein